MNLLFKLNSNSFTNILIHNNIKELSTKTSILASLNITNVLKKLTKLKIDQTFIKRKQISI